MLGNVQYLMANLDTRSAMMRTRMDSISAFMRYRELSPELNVRGKATPPRRTRVRRKWSLLLLLT